MNIRYMLVLLSILSVASCDDPTLQQKRTQEPSKSVFNANTAKEEVHISVNAYEKLQKLAGIQGKRKRPVKPTTRIGIPITEYERLKRLAGIRHGFAFSIKEHHIPYTEGTYTQRVNEEIVRNYSVELVNGTVTVKKDTSFRDDMRHIIYTSSHDKIATVDADGRVNFLTAGTVIITAHKEKTEKYAEVHDSYTLYITTNISSKPVLVKEIQRAMKEHGETVDLNYIDVSAITDMSFLFSSHDRYGYGLHTFNGNINRWNVRNVRNMRGMFYGATTFKQSIDGWVGKLHRNLINTVFYWVERYIWIYAAFANSGLEHELPIWCRPGHSTGGLWRGDVCKGQALYVPDKLRTNGTTD